MKLFLFCIDRFEPRRQKDKKASQRIISLFFMKLCILWFKMIY